MLRLRALGEGFVAPTPALYQARACAPGVLDTAGKRTLVDVDEGARRPGPAASSAISAPISPAPTTPTWSHPFATLIWLLFPKSVRPTAKRWPHAAG